MRAAEILIVIGTLQFLFGSSATLAFSGLYGPSWQRFVLLEVTSGVGPLMMAIGAWQFRRASRRPFLWLATGGTVLFALYGAISAMDSVHNWKSGNDTKLGLMLNLLWLVLPFTAIWMTAILWKTRAESRDQ